LATGFSFCHYSVVNGVWRDVSEESANALGAGFAASTATGTAADSTAFGA
jgi:hypothetical protein